MLYSIANQFTCTIYAHTLTPSHLALLTVRPCHHDQERAIAAELTQHLTTGTTGTHKGMVVPGEGVWKRVCVGGCVCEGVCVHRIFIMCGSFTWRLLWQ